jgi:hypothetical protein
VITYTVMVIPPLVERLGQMLSLSPPYCFDTKRVQALLQQTTSTFLAPHAVSHRGDHGPLLSKRKEDRRQPNGDHADEDRKWCTHLDKVHEAVITGALDHEVGLIRGRCHGRADGPGH